MAKARNVKHPEIVKLFDSLSGSKGAWEVWNDVITMMAVTISNTCDGNGTLYISCEDYGLIKTVLELQIPKKPEQGTTNTFIYACPTCGGPVGSLEVEEIWCDFCPKCGQAIQKER